jgi:hypothetical protein
MADAPRSEFPLCATCGRLARWRDTLGNLLCDAHRAFAQGEPTPIIEGTDVEPSE